MTYRNHVEAQSAAWRRRARKSSKHGSFDIAVLVELRAHCERRRRTYGYSCGPMGAEAYEIGHALRHRFPEFGLTIFDQGRKTAAALRRIAAKGLATYDDRFHTWHAGGRKLRLVHDAALGEKDDG